MGQGRTLAARAQGWYGCSAWDRLVVAPRVTSALWKGDREDAHGESDGRAPFRPASDLRSLGTLDVVALAKPVSVGGNSQAELDAHAHSRVDRTAELAPESGVDLHVGEPEPVLEHLAPSGDDGARIRRDVGRRIGQVWLQIGSYTMSTPAAVRPNELAIPAPMLTAYVVPGSRGRLASG